MDYQLRLDDRINRAAWKAFIDAHSEGSIFQSPEIFDFFRSVKGYVPLALACLDSDEKIRGILVSVIHREGWALLSKFKSRAIIWGGPIVEEGELSARVFAELIGALVDKVRKETTYIEVRDLYRSRWETEFKKWGFDYRDHLNYLVETSDEARLLSRLSASRRRQIKKSLAAGVEIREAKTIADVGSFYAILKDLYQKKVRKPLPDWSFFESFFHQAKAGDWGRFLLILYQGRIIGGMMCPVYRDRFIYEWYVCGLDKEFKDLYPSVMATWSALDFAVKKGIKFFDFMGAGSPDQDYGVREFKSKFGGTEVNFGRYLRINKRVVYRIGTAALEASRRVARWKSRKSRARG